MSFVTQTRHVLPAARFGPVSFRRIHNSLAALSESSDLGAEKIVRKEETKQVKGKRKSGMRDHPDWSEDLATDSEASVKADSDSLHDVKELQDHSISVIAEVHEETTVKESSKVDKDAA